MTRVIRFGAGALAELPDVLRELGAERPMALTTRRGADVAGSISTVAQYAGARPHVPVETVREAAIVARSHRADAIVAIGGGSAVDTAKATAVELPSDPAPIVVAIPTTYAGAEWTPYFGLLLAPGRKGGSMDERARPVGAVYDPELTLTLPAGATVGTAMNALAHCAEALYHPETTADAVRHAESGASEIGAALPGVVAEPASVELRAELMRGAMHAAIALADSGLCLGHAMAQGLGGRYGLPQGTMNALCLPVALRFNASAVPEAVAAFGEALGGDAATRVEELAALGSFGRLRDHGVPEDELDDVAAEIADRAGARANPRPVATSDVVELLHAIW